MNKKLNRRIKLGFVIIILLIITTRLYFTIHNNQKNEEWINNIKIEFSGKIINKQEVTRGGRRIVIICVKIDYSNTDSIVLQSKDKFRYLKISDKIATMVIPAELYEIDSVALNIKNNRIERYYKNGILEVEYPLSLNSAYATEKDLQICDNLK